MDLPNILRACISVAALLAGAVQFLAVWSMRRQAHQLIPRLIVFIFFTNGAYDLILSASTIAALYLHAPPPVIHPLWQLFIFVVLTSKMVATSMLAGLMLGVIRERKI